MDCLTAQELLEAARPGSVSDRSLDEASLPELELALAHTEECRTCAAVWEMMQTRDRVIAQAMQAVAVPDGLEERLLDRLGLTGLDWSETPQPSPTVELDSGDAELVEREPVESALVLPADRHDGRRSRRHVLAALCVVSASLLVGVGLWSWLTVNSEVTLAELQQAVPNRLAGLPAFDGNFTSELPREFQHQPTVQVNSSVRGLLLPGGSRHIGVLHEIAVLGPQKRAIRAVLLVVPIERVDVKSRTLATSLLTAPEESLGRRAVAAWSDSSYLYVCFVDRQDGSLQDVKHAVAPGLT